MGALLPILINLFGPPAIKAVVGGAASAGAVLVGEALGACDLESIGAKVGAAAGAFIVGHLATWLSPANRPMKS